MDLHNGLLDHYISEDSLWRIDIYRNPEYYIDQESVNPGWKSGYYRDTYLNRTLIMGAVFLLR